MKYFFEIPIFRVDNPSYIKEIKLKVSKCAEVYKNKSNIDGYDYESMAERNYESEYSNFRYGELVGYIRLFVLGNQIRGELYFIKQKISSHLKNKTWSLIETKTFEICIFDKYTNKEICEIIINNISEYKKDYKKLKNLFIDLECFGNVCEFIDFKLLIKNN